MEPDLIDANSAYRIAKERAKEHNEFYHYTNINALCRILDSQCFRLSQMERLNDPIEEERVDSLKKKKVFVASFTHNQENSYTMWGSDYTNADTGIRIRVKSLDFFEEKSNYNLSNNDWLIYSADVLDVIYDDDLSKYMIRHFPLGEDSAPSYYPGAVGIVKKSCWVDECETRARLSLEVGQNNRSRVLEIQSAAKKTNMLNDEIGYNYPGLEYIYCKIPTEVLKSITFLFHPEISSENRQNHIEHLTKKHVYIKKEQFR